MYEFLGYFSDLPHSFFYFSSLKLKDPNMTEFEADYGYYKTISILGQGFNGMMAVHLAKHLPTGRMIALKRFNMDRIKEEAHLVEVCY